MGQVFRGYPRTISLAIPPWGKEMNRLSEQNRRRGVRRSSRKASSRHLSLTCFSHSTHPHAAQHSRRALTSAKRSLR